MSRWKKWEQACASYLAERSGLEVTTTRNLGMGRQLGYDLALPDRSPPLGWHIEAKYTRNSHQVKDWVGQAEEQAAGGRWVVWANTPGRSSDLLENSPGDGHAYVLLSDLVPYVQEGGGLRRLCVASFVDLMLADWSVR